MRHIHLDYLITRIDGRGASRDATSDATHGSAVSDNVARRQAMQRTRCHALQWWWHRRGANRDAASDATAAVGCRTDEVAEQVEMRQAMQRSRLTCMGRGASRDAASDATAIRLMLSRSKSRDDKRCNRAPLNDVIPSGVVAEQVEMRQAMQPAVFSVPAASCYRSRSKARCGKRCNPSGMTRGRTRSSKSRSKSICGKRCNPNASLPSRGASRYAASDATDHQRTSVA